MANGPLTPLINTLEMGDLVLIKPAFPVKKIIYLYQCHCWRLKSGNIFSSFAAHSFSNFQLPHTRRAPRM
jgi:hypothetical protein